jgi:hypothetical protein
VECGMPEQDKSLTAADDLSPFGREVLQLNLQQ